MTVSVRENTIVEAAEPVAVTVNSVCANGTAGVPLSTPVVALQTSPEGSVGATANALAHPAGVTVGLQLVIAVPTRNAIEVGV